MTSPKKPEVRLGKSSPAKTVAKAPAKVAAKPIVKSVTKTVTTKPAVVSKTPTKVVTQTTTKVEVKKSVPVKPVAKVAPKAAVNPVKISPKGNSIAPVKKTINDTLKEQMSQAMKGQSQGLMFDDKDVTNPVVRNDNPRKAPGKISANELFSRMQQNMVQAMSPIKK